MSKKVDSSVFGELKINSESGFWGNDAIAQMLLGVHTLLGDSSQTLPQNKSIGYIGPGTGLGGGFCVINSDKTISIITDGHIFDIILSSGSEKKEVSFKIAQETISIAFPDNPTSAETLFSGNAISFLLTQINEQMVALHHPPFFNDRYPKDAFDLPEASVVSDLLSISAPSESEKKLVTIAHSIAVFEGTILANLISHIYLGDIRKIDSPNAWSKADKERVRCTTTFLIGGSVGSDAKLGSIICDTASSILATLYPTTLFTFHQCSSNKFAGSYGAFHFIPPAELRRELAKISVP